jgi:hypothetical protein
VHQAIQVPHGVALPLTIGLGASFIGQLSKARYENSSGKQEQKGGLKKLFHGFT